MANPRVRPPAVAGQFYPATAQALGQLVDQLVSSAAQAHQSAKAIITPHAGLMYSGALAARAWLAGVNPEVPVARIVLLGPSHRVYLQGLATSEASHWESPLGMVPLAVDAAERLLDLPQVRCLNQAHALEHSLEVQLPLIQRLFPQAWLLPLVVGDASPDQVAEVVDQFLGQADTLIAVSSDLSHFHPYPEAMRVDARTADAIENCDIERIGPEQACGCRPLNGLLTLAAREGWQIQRLALCNSGDLGADKQSVVGYGAFALH